MKEKKKVRIEEFVYMLIVICVVVFLFYSDCMDKYLYTLDAVKIVKNCLYIFLGGGTVICSFRFCWFRCEQGIVKKSIFFIGKIIVVIWAWRLILLYFCVYCIYRGLENKDTVKCYGNFVEIIYVFLTIFLYLLKCPQSLILSALRAFCFCGKPHISRSIFLYFRYQAWLKSW